MPENNVIVETAKCVWVSNEKKDHLIVINQNQSSLMERFLLEALFVIFSALLLKKQSVLRKKNFQRHLTTQKIDLEKNLWQMLRP